jgi:hypothetical protein
MCRAKYAGPKHGFFGPSQAWNIPSTNCAWTEGAAVGRHDTTYLENIKYNLISAYTNKLLWPRSMTISSIP